MAYQAPKIFLDLQLDFYTGLHHVQNVFDVSKINTNNLTTLILITIMLVLLLSKSKSGINWFKVVSPVQKANTQKKIIKAKFILPIRLPVIDAIYTMVKLRQDGLQFIERLTERYGNLFEFPFGPFTFTIVSDPAIIQKLLSSNQLVYLNRPKVYKSIFGDIFNDGLVLSENEMWTAQRKMLSRSFTYKSLQNFVVFMNTHAANLTSSLIHDSEQNDNKLGIGVQRINQLLYCHSFKIIGQIVMGTDSISAEECNEIAENSNCVKDLISDKLLNPWKYLWLLPKRTEYKRVHKYLKDFSVKMTQKYKKEYERTKLNPLDIKSAHLDTECEDEDESVGIKPFRCMIEEMLCSGASDKEIHDQVETISGTGHETTVVAIKMLMLHLALNPDHQIACREEIDKVINQKGTKHNMRSDTGSFNLTMEDLIELKYLERCILESGRITSIVPLFGRRVDAPLKIDDNLEFPAGTNFLISNWTMHRDPQIYPEPLKFDPDRFLSENVKKRHPYSYTAFSLGPRNCIGWKVAITQFKVIMTYILRHFEIFTDDKLENIKLHFALTVVPERDYNITIKRREQY